ncbi:hypothetical protein ACFLVP_01985 [Chloroflexota bacterium]
MEIPLDILERLSSRPKMIADPKMNLEQLRRKPESTRRDWWNTLNAVEAECDAMTYERNKYLDASVSIAKLKLISVFKDKDELVPPDHGFTDEEVALLGELEEYIIYDRMSTQEIMEYIMSGSNDKGIMKLAEHAAMQNYQQINSVLAEKNIPGDLAFAFQTIYQERIKKMQMAAAKYMEESGGLLETKELMRSTEEEKARIDADAKKLEELTERVTAAGRSLEQEKEQYQQKTAEMESITKMIKEDESFTSGAVNANEARLMERTYIGQVESKLKKSSGELKWKKIETFDGLNRVSRELGRKHKITQNEVKQKLPNELGVRAVIEERKGLSKKPVFCMQVKVISNYEQLYINGFDSRKMNVADIAQHSQQVLEDSKDCPSVSVLASTTGWSDKAIDYIQGGELSSPELSAVLIDLKSKELYYYKPDHRLSKVLYYLNAK